MSSLTYRPTPSIARMSHDLAQARAHRNTVIAHMIRGLIAATRNRLVTFWPTATARPLTPHSAA